MDSSTDGQGAFTVTPDFWTCDIDTKGISASALQQCLAKNELWEAEALQGLFSKAADIFAVDAATDTDAEFHCGTAIASLHVRGFAGEDLGLERVTALWELYREVSAKLKRALDTAASVRVAAELDKRFADFDAHIAQRAYTEAAWTALELQKATATLPDAAAAVEARLEQLRQYLIAAPVQYLAVDHTHIPVLRQPQRETAMELRDIWVAAEVLGVLPQALQELSTFSLERCLQPSLVIPSAFGAVGAELQSPAGSVGLPLLSMAPTWAERRSAVGTERAIYKALKVLCDQVLGGRAELALQLGAMLWPATSSAYIAAKLCPARPQTEDRLDVFLRSGALGVRLEAKAAKLGLLPVGAKGPVEEYVNQAARDALRIKRARYANAARELLTPLVAEQGTVVVPGSGVPGADTLPPACSLFHAAAGVEVELAAEASVVGAGQLMVTKGADGLVNLMKQALAEACKSSSPVVLHELCGAVADMAALLVALAPAVSAGTAAGNSTAAGLVLPYPAALHYNDCMHVHRAMCTLPHLYAPRLQALGHTSISFTAPALRVKAAGDKALATMLQREEAQLVDIAAQVSAFQGMDGPGVVRCKKGVMQLLHAFRRLGSVLHSVLPDPTFVRVSAALIEAVCGRIADDILAFDDISVDESEQIPHILADLISGALYDAVLMGSGAKQQRPAASSVSSGVPNEAKLLRAALLAATPSVARLRQLCELMEARLAEIRRRWDSGALAAAGLSSQQVSHLVQALFEDTPPRRDLISHLRGSRVMPR